VATGPAPQIGDELPSEPPGPPPVDRLALANVVKVIQRATTEAGKGAADYDSLDAAASYEGDNLVSSITDGLARGIQMPVPQANAESRSAFQAEGIGGKFEHDAFGRVKKGQGGTTNPYEVSVQFKADAKGKKDAGLPERVAKGNGQIWSSFDFDPQNNLKRLKTSQGAEALADYDLWDRLVRSKEGLADGRLAPVGNGRCGIAAEGSITERAFDAAGHLARERRLQDFIDADGNLQCRWVESSYTYNLREQLVEVAQTHLADPNEPGRVEPAARTLMRLEYDAFGRLQRHVSLNSANPNVETVFDYDAAGRVRSVKLGDAGAQTRAYDRKSRVVKTTDGHEAVWRGRYDVWDRLFLSQSPTGAFTKNVFDKAGHLTETVTTDRDPFGEESGQAQLLAKTKSHFTSFSEPDKVVEILVDEQTGQRQILVTSREFDDAGRTKAVWSGPAQAEAEEIDPERKRRETETVYEAGTGRVLESWRGGYAGQPPLVKQKFDYLTDNASPWPDRMAFLEAVPGQPELVETASASYRRDAVGRVIEEKRNDGSLVSTTYDRSSNLVLQVRTGADSVTRASYDGAGRQIRVIRPNDRGQTLYARDLDGRLLEQVVKTAGSDWVTSYDYDRTGRPTKTTYHDGSFAETTYNPDNTVATQRGRDGVLVSFGYDAANRPLFQVPSLAAGADTSHLVALDAGNFAGYDKLSRPTSLSRGSAGGTAADAGLSVIYPNYDLGSRPGSEVVGARGPMSWQYDVYSRREKTILPVGPGRDSNGPFQGWSRQFDTLDRVVDVAGVGTLSTANPGATWTWGGGRLYATNTKGGLGTSLRLGYLGGEGPQLPGGAVSADSKWKLGTLTWGAGGNSATGMPATTWGQFGFGYRGTEGDPRDGAKIGREAMAGEGLDLFAGQGWSWDYDAGVRLSAAWPGRGDLQGGEPQEADGFRYEYGKGDELERVIDESAGTIADTETGAYGRITSRGGVPFSYDQSGRRAEDDRFAYLWNWRSELMQVTVKEAWPNGEETPFAGHQIRYAYDAMGRLHSRSHHGPLPAGVTDESQRPLVEKRVFVWEGQSLLAEAGYGDQAETQLRWRKTYVPGAGGLDDAVQVVVENVAFPAQGKKLYTYLRDELGTVLGVVAEEESQDPANPTIPARYHYTPYGEAHAEIGPELRRARFDAGVLNVAGTQQAAATPQTASGALRLTFSIPVDPATIAAGLAFEEQTQSGWQAVSGAEMLTGFEGEEGLDLLISLRSAWKRNSNYRIRAVAALKDEIGRALATERQVEFTIPDSAAFTTAPVDHRFPIDYESWRTAGDTLAGRFPGGQTSLFQGLWTDPVTGVNYARARWYDSRNATWLSEDPLLDIDSPNLYAFVGWSPHSGIDPLGLWEWSDVGAGVASLGKTLAIGVGTVAVATAVVAAGVVSAPVVIAAGVVIGAAMVVDASIDRYKEQLDEKDTADVGDAVKLGLGDAAGVTPVMEGIAGVDMGTGTELSTRERWERGGSGAGALATAVIGPKVTKTVSSRMSPRAVTPEPAAPKKALRSRQAVDESVGGEFLDDGMRFSKPTRVPEGLQAHENAGGHLIDRHVGKTEDQLAARLVTDTHISASSSFPDLPTAEAAVAETLLIRQAEIQNWLSGQAPSYTARANVGWKVGTSLPRGAQSASPATSVRVVLRRDSSLSCGYRIHTGYPEL
jgi:RHS repeat-associated protein